MQLKTNKNGFSAVEALLILVVVGILGFTGWFVYRSTQATNKNLTSSKQTTVPKGVVDTFAKCKASAGSIMQETCPETCVTKSGQHFTDVGEASIVEVIHADGTVTTGTVASTSKTVDQAAILQAIFDKDCSQQPSNLYVIVNEITFDSNPNFIEIGNHAIINSGCGIKATVADDIGGSGREIGLHKDTKSQKWVIDYESQDGEPCSAVDGKGYPVKLIPSCIDDNGQSRTPSA